eukprot:TRINITY_DN41946_c0_g1_i1.p1 TRINITY_DN41946_c0_g1~~TRINITY_DN41946_c0_g1_i1.p1  ORF type:complete len:191 (-),score=31.95 TRINITY_DN41946_c0_g1_i1:124-696(-)
MTQSAMQIRSRSCKHRWCYHGLAFALFLLGLQSWQSKPQDGAFVNNLLASRSLGPSLSSSSRKLQSRRSVSAAGAGNEIGLPSLLSKEEFEMSIKGPVTLAMFSSSLCGPCMLIEPKVAEMRAEFEGSGVNVVKVSLNPGSKSAEALKPLFSELKVRQLPTFFVYKDGQLYERLEGKSHAELRSIVEGLI